MKLDDIFGQDAAVDWLRNAFLADRLPHGLIFAGPIGVGKKTTANAMGALFLCEKPTKDQTPCGTCKSCLAMSAEIHPDFHVVYRQLIRLEKESVKAKELVKEVVELHLIQPAFRKAVLGRGKVFLIKEAELMNPHAQNALLKTLEEPAGRTLIILLTDQPDCLLPTIRSRTQTVQFRPLDENIVIRELKNRGIDDKLATRAAHLTRGSLGLALKWIKDGVIEYATELIEQIDAMFNGRAPENLLGWFKKAADAYAERQLVHDSLGSKDTATREGMNLYLMLAAEHIRQRLSKSEDSEELERACAAIDAIARAETYLDSNVNVSLVFQQLAAALSREVAA